MFVLSSFDFFIDFGYKSLIRNIICKYFLSFCKWSFLFIDGVLWSTINKFLILMKFNFSTSFFNIFYWLCYYSCPISPLHSPPPCIPPPTHIPPFSSDPWIIHVSSLASVFPTLFLTSPCLFSTYHLCYLFSVYFLPLTPSHSSTNNPPCGLHFWDSVPVLVVCLVVFFVFF